jgi:hypothetical protein
MLKCARAGAALMPEKRLQEGEAASALATVSPERAFHFYKAIGQPLDASARSLGEFATTVKGVDPSSVKFHVERGDFEGWFKMLGDKSLVDQVASLRGKNMPPDELKARVSAMVRTRVDQLRKPGSQRSKRA